MKRSSVDQVKALCNLMVDVANVMPYGDPARETAIKALREERASAIELAEHYRLSLERLGYKEEVN